MKKDIYRSSRVCNIISAAVEYFISMLVIDSYLAKLTSDIGIPDSVTGILTSFVSLGFGFLYYSIDFSSFLCYNNESFMGCYRTGN